MTVVCLAVITDGALDVHAVVVHVAEQAREQIHVVDAGKRLLGELREVQHRDLAILLLHLFASLLFREEIHPAFEDVADGPGVGCDAGEFFFFRQRPADARMNNGFRSRLLGWTCHHSGRGE